jgi:hypothetical protein
MSRDDRAGGTGRPGRGQLPGGRRWPSDSTGTYPHPEVRLSRYGIVHLSMRSSNEGVSVSSCDSSRARGTLSEMDDGPPPPDGCVRVERRTDLMLHPKREDHEREEGHEACDHDEPVALPVPGRHPRLTCVRHPGDGGAPVSGTTSLPAQALHRTLERRRAG